MNFRFRKSMKILPGVRINLTQRGLSANVGGKHANIGIGKRGVRANASIPGTGISGTQQLSGRPSHSEPVQYTPDYQQYYEPADGGQNDSLAAKIAFGVAVFVVIVFLLAYLAATV